MGNYTAANKKAHRQRSRFHISNLNFRYVTPSVNFCTGNNAYFKRKADKWRVRVIACIINSSIIFVSIVLAIVAIPLLSYAIDVSISEIDNDMDLCINKNSTTVGVTKCVNDAYDRFDKVLNKNYNILMELLPVNGRNILKTAQIKWIEYRDKEFKLIDEVYSHLDGTMYIPMHANDKLTIVRQRALKINIYTNYMRDK